MEKDNLAILKGKCNIEASSPKVERAEITADLMKKLNANLQKYNMEKKETRMVWSAITCFFAGSLIPYHWEKEERRSLIKISL